MKTRRESESLTQHLGVSRWGGAESRIAAQIFREHCSANESSVAPVVRPVVLDVGAHVGYFTLLARAHGCSTRSLELDRDLLPFHELSLRMNDFETGPADGKLHWGYVGETASTCAAMTDVAPQNLESMEGAVEPWGGVSSPQRIELDDLLVPAWSGEK